MDQLTLGDLFSKHLGFPSHKGAKLSAESFAEKLEDRAHGFFAPDQVDPLAWVEHFFEMEQPLEERERELTRLADRFTKKSAVLEFELASEEFVVIENDDEVVVVSDGGSLVLSRTEELTRALRQAQLPQHLQHSPTQAFKPAGERAYHVTQAGAVSAIDVKAVAAVLKNAHVRVEPLARVADAPARLQAFAPVTRVQPAAPSPSSAQVAASAPRRSSAVPQRLAPVVKVVEAERRRDGRPQVVVLERGGAREQSGAQARFWQRLASGLARSGAQDRPVQGPGGVSAVALGRQTYAVKVGGVTALVQRPTTSIAARAQGADARAQSIVDRRSNAPMTRWLRSAVDETPRAGGYWIQPSVRPGAEGRPAWVDWAMSQARQARERARLELSAGRGAEQLSARTVQNSSQLTGAASTLSPQSVRALQPAASAQVDDFVLPRFRVSDTGSVDYLGPMSYAGALPATTLRALYTGLERTAALEGHHLPRLTVDLDPTRPQVEGARPQLSGLSVRSLSLETEPVLPSSTSAEPSVQGSAALPLESALSAGESVRTQIVTVPVTIESLRPAEPMGRAAAAAESRAAQISESALSVSPAGADFVREPSPRLLQSIFTLPFSSGSNVRVGRELSLELEQVMGRNWAAEPPAAATALSPVQLPASAPTASEQARLDVQALSGGARPLPAAAFEPSAPAAGLRDLSPRVWLDWALSNAPYAYAKKSSDPIAAAPAGSPVFNTEVHAHVHVTTGAEAQPALGSHAPSGTPVIGSHRQAPAAWAPGALPAAREPGTPAIGGHRELSTTPLPLSEVNLRRLPSHSGESVGREHEAEGLDEFVVPQPLYAQMGAIPPAAPPPPSATPRRMGVAQIPTTDGGSRVREVAPPSEASRASSSSSAGQLPPLRSEPRAARLDMAVTRTPSAPPATVLAAPQPAAPLHSDGTPSAGRAPASASASSSSSAAASASSARAPAAPPPQGVASSGPRAAPPPSLHSDGARIDPAFARDLGALRLQESGGLHGGLGAQAHTGGSDVHLGSGPQLQLTPHEAMHVVQQGAAAAPGAEEIATTSAVRRKEKSSSSASVSSSASGSALPHYDKIQASFGKHDLSQVQAYTGSQAASASRAIGAQAYATGSRIALSGSPSLHTTAHEASHVIQQSHGVVGTPRLKAKGSGTLRFRFPSAARWWTDAVGGGQSSSGAGSFQMATGAKSPEVVRASGGVSAGDPLPTLGSRARGAAPQLPSAGGIQAPAALARGRRAAGGSAAAGSAGGGEGALVQPVEGGSHLTPQGSEMAYVAIGHNGEAAVVGPQAAAALKRSQKERGTSVDMTVVAAIAPQAPSMEEMALAGHERPHAKGKKEGGAKAGGTAKNDSMSLQGTVDSLAQRIYHRLKRRLQSDRERFGG